ncbi:MAG: addiction module antidote protein [Hyphomicrobiales bacterium]
MALETLPWDPIQSLTTDAARKAYLEAAFEDGDPQLIAAALGDIARSKGISVIAKEAGLSRDAIYKTFHAAGNPTLGSVTKLAAALGYQLSVTERPKP